MSATLDGKLSPMEDLAGFAVGAAISEWSARTNNLSPGLGVGMYCISEGLESVIKPALQHLTSLNQAHDSLRWNILLAVALAYPVARVMNYMGHQEVTMKKVLWTNVTPAITIAAAIGGAAIFAAATSVAVNAIRG